jgi:serine/threonine protein kinase
MTQPPDVVTLTERRPGPTCKVQHCKIWWQVKGNTENDVLYARFSTRDPTPELRRRAVMKAAASNTNAVEVSENGTITEANWLDPFESPFEAPEDIPKVRRDELTTIRQIKRGVDVVQYNGAEYVHKYMTVDSTPHSFVSEIGNYKKNAGSPSLPKFHSIITHNGVNRGILIEYLSSKSLDNAQLTLSEKYAVIGLLLNALTDLEARGYYPQDLKLSNILLSNDKRVLHIIDLGSGITRGMHRVSSWRRISQGKMNSQDMCYTFGRTVSHLYAHEGSDESSDESSHEGSDELSVESLPELIQGIVIECCGNEMDQTVQVGDVCRKYSVLLEKAASQE